MIITLVHPIAAILSLDVSTNTIKTVMMEMMQLKIIATTPLDAYTAPLQKVKLKMDITINLKFTL
jgi:uncharacterized protein YhhL (DUF1145 family)